MNTLIEITEQVIDGDAIQTVNARDLHAFLGVGKKFADWITERINKYDFVENRDYIVFPNFGKTSKVVVPLKIMLSL